MSNSNVEILRKALAAAGHDQALALTNAILPPEAAALAAVAGTMGVAPMAPEVGTVVAPGPLPPGVPTPPPGKAPLLTEADVDALSQAEMVERMDEVDHVLYSQKGQ